MPLGAHEVMHGSACDAPATVPPAPTQLILHAFAAIGIELEYAIVAADTLDVLPIADWLLAQDAAASATDVVRGTYGWSNELVLHVIEIKNLAPAATLVGVADGFAAEVSAIDAVLSKRGARLLPGAMHPWMNPVTQTQLWPHENAPIYRQFDRIFDCARHGWANLQSMHVNLPFAGDAEFSRLHAAIRLVLPIIPALAASSPFVDGVDAGCTDGRMAAYRDNAADFPAIGGEVIPPTMCSRAQYEAQILAPAYRAIAPHDPQALLQHEWLNAHGAIARFDRNAIEIRVTDTQECPRADIAIAGAIAAVVHMLYDEHSASLAMQQACTTEVLVTLLQRCIAFGETACIDGPAGTAYLRLLGYPAAACSGRQLWHYLIENLPVAPGIGGTDPGALGHILEQGTLATRLRRAAGAQPSHARLRAVYGELADCLQARRMFDGDLVARA